MTVHEYLDFEYESLLEELAEENSYWASVLEFITSNWNKQIEKLTAKQLSWLDKIYEGLLKEQRVKEESGY